jgi:hypothetical protein
VHDIRVWVDDHKRLASCVVFAAGLTAYAVDAPLTISEGFAVLTTVAASRYTRGKEIAKIGRVGTAAGIAVIATAPTCFHG